MSVCIRTVAVILNRAQQERCLEIHRLVGNVRLEPPTRAASTEIRRQFVKLNSKKSQCMELELNDLKQAPIQ